MSWAYSLLRRTPTPWHARCFKILMEALDSCALAFEQAFNHKAVPKRRLLGGGSVSHPDSGSETILDAAHAIAGASNSRLAFANTSNTCYLGSLLQLLLSIPRLTQALRDHSSAVCGRPSCGTCLMARSESSTQDGQGPVSVTPWQAWLTSQGLQWGKQHDPQELLQKLLAEATAAPSMHVWPAALTMAAQTEFRCCPTCSCMAPYTRSDDLLCHMVPLEIRASDHNAGRGGGAAPM